jgi:hypothetical protein
MAQQGKWLVLPMMAVNIETGYHRGVNKNAPAGKIIEKRGDLFVVSPSAVY